MIGILIKSFIGVGTRLLLSLGSEKLIEWAFFKVADVVVKNTKTPHDDEFLKELKKSYQSK